MIEYKRIDLRACSDKKAVICAHAARNCDKNVYVRLGTDNINMYEYRKFDSINDHFITMEFCKHVSAISESYNDEHFIDFAYVPSKSEHLIDLEAVNGNHFHARQEDFYIYSPDDTNKIHHFIGVREDIGGRFNVFFRKLGPLLHFKEWHEQFPDLAILHSRKTINLLEPQPLRVIVATRKPTFNEGDEVRCFDLSGSIPLQDNSSTSNIERPFKIVSLTESTFGDTNCNALIQSVLTKQRFLVHTDKLSK